ncbi:uncharacterized protein LOC124619678 isoform X1 [Schistocerca americana]|uniref:uncharacterized protein LOC124619678 isoform X1 n=1 Tax=Schistocerca americana TaxID=7009 RepID=UPI001F502FAA|nr:uncharacterized protein LOC124619678 isoform X1 [Schistocerca americana]
MAAAQYPKDGSVTIATISTGNQMPHQSFTLSVVIKVTDVTVTLGPEFDLPDQPFSKINVLLCDCKAILGVYWKIPPPDKPQFTKKYLLNGDKLLRYASRKGFIEALKLDEEIKNLSDKVSNLNDQVMLSLWDIVRIKEVLCLVANDPELMNLLKLDTPWTNTSCDVDDL